MRRLQLAALSAHPAAAKPTTTTLRALPHPRVWSSVWVLACLGAQVGTVGVREYLRLAAADVKKRFFKSKTVANKHARSVRSKTANVRDTCRCARQRDTWQRCSVTRGGAAWRHRRAPTRPTAPYAANTPATQRTDKPVRPHADKRTAELVPKLNK